MSVGSSSAGSHEQVDRAPQGVASRVVPLIAFQSLHESARSLIREGEGGGEERLDQRLGRCGRSWGYSVAGFFASVSRHYGLLSVFSFADSGGTLAAGRGRSRRDVPQ